MDEKVNKPEVVLKVGQMVKVDIDGHPELYEVQAVGVWRNHALVFQEAFVELHSTAVPKRVIRLFAHPLKDQRP